MAAHPTDCIAVSNRPAKARFFVGLVGLTAVTAIVWLTVWVVIVPPIFGWSPVAVMSGSMEPLIDTGDIVVVAPYDGDQLAIGSVITFDNDSTLGWTTHRIINITPDGNYVTHGDANGRIDSTPVAPDEIVGVGRMLIPGIGRPLAWIETGQWFLVALTALMTAAALWASRWALLGRFNPWTSGLIVPAIPGSKRRLTIGLAPVAAIAVIALVATVVTTTRTTAAFATTTVNTANSMTADTLQPPTALGAAASGSDIDLTWTATADLYADGYNIYRSTTLGGPYSYHDSVVGQGTNAYTDVGANSRETPTFESVATAIQGPGSGLSVTVAVPAGTTDGDVLIAVIGVDNSGDTYPIGAPGGWTELFQQRLVGGGQNSLGVWYRVASSEPADYTFTWPIAEEGFGAISRYSGVDTSTPIDVWGVNGVTSDASPTAPDVTTTVSNALVLRVMGADGNDHVEPSPLSSIHPAGTTGRFELITDTTGSGGTFGALAEKAQATAGPTGTALFNITGSDGWAAATIALRSAPGPTYYYVTDSYDVVWTSVYSNEATL